MPDWLSLLIAGVGSVGLWKVIETVITNRARSKVTDAEASKTSAEAKSILSEAESKTLEGAYKYMDRLEKQINTLTVRADQQDSEIGWLRKAMQAYAERIAYLMGGIATLIKQLGDLRQAPCWTPDDWQPPEEPK
jgi:peptidoglycan hydrolase CwlO-like protein